MADAFVGEIRLMAFENEPSAWAECDGRTLSPAAYPDLFALVGTTYGGDGVSTFGLPDLRGRVPIHASDAHPLGVAGGEAKHALTAIEVPVHTHSAQATAVAGDDPLPAGRTWGVQSAGLSYAQAPDVALAPAAVAPVGTGQPHENMSPYLAMKYFIALEGAPPIAG